MTEQEKREKVINDLDEQIAWIRDNDFHKFPGWGHAVIAIRDALALLKAQDTLIRAYEVKGEAYWIHCKGKSHVWYCSHCGEKINYNNARKTYTKGMKPIEQVNRFCRGCGFTMIPCPTDEQRQAVKWE